MYIKNYQDTTTKHSEDIKNCVTPANNITDMKPFENYQVGKITLVKYMQCKYGSNHLLSSNLQSQ